MKFVEHVDRNGPVRVEISFIIPTVYISRKFESNLVLNACPEFHLITYLKSPNGFYLAPFLHDVGCIKKDVMQIRI